MGAFLTVSKRPHLYIDLKQSAIKLNTNASKHKMLNQLLAVLFCFFIQASAVDPNQAPSQYVVN